MFADATLVEAKPVTGRTHQIRVHAAHLAIPSSATNATARRKPIRRFAAGGSSACFCTRPNWSSPTPSAASSCACMRRWSRSWTLFCNNYVDETAIRLDRVRLGRHADRLHRLDRA
ncbi:hypothetical protein [Methylogaea oryzae]|uniref:hypothetical protein n=1 Tax=Methylogaea oryzae TaxID=1295382 RepID=UPI00402B3CD8